MKILKSDKTFVDALRKSIEERKLTRIGIAAWHKGCDVEFDGKFKAKEKADFKDQVEEWYYTFDDEENFLYLRELALSISKGKIIAEVTFCHSWDDLGDWDGASFAEMVAGTIHELEGKEISGDAILINCQASGNVGGCSMDDWDVSFEPEKFTISDATEKALESKAEEMLGEWIEDQLQHSEEENYQGYSCSIDDNEVSSIEETWDETYEIKA